jgi:uncharacterized protein (TIGR03437 family)
MKQFLAGILAISLPFCAFPRQDGAVCGTHAEIAKEQIYLHQRSIQALAAAGKLRPLGLAERSAAKDIGAIATLDDSNGIIARANPFDLDNKTLSFQPSAPSAARYKFTVSGSTYSGDDATNGTPLNGIQDDDSRSLALPFTFPFFGATYNSIYVNSDGNLTFGQGDADTSARSLGRMTAGAPRISPLFADLDPSRSLNGLTVLSAADRFVVTWTAVPDYSSSGGSILHTFQVRLFPDGRIEFAWATVGAIASAVIGIAPGHLQGVSTVLSFSAGSSQEYSAAVAETFGAATSVDMIRAAQRFYETHEDAYDYLIVYNALGIPARAGAVAYESTVRNDRLGYADYLFDNGALYGSPRRLQSVINMGPVDGTDVQSSNNNYPLDPNGHVALRGATGDTPLTVIAHEMGHLFLAFASIRDPQNPDSRPLLNPLNNAHWGFNFNSDASLLEGNRIQDSGPNAIPRFLTVATVQGYSALDQYLMGFRAKEDVPLTFLVQNSNRDQSRLPQAGVSIDGVRRDVAVDEIIAAEGRRSPDYTVSQRNFRAAIVVITPSGSDPPPNVVQQVETYRAGIESFYNTATGGRATLDTALVSKLDLSLWPAGGVLAGSSATGSLTLAQPAAADVIVQLTSDNGDAAVPATVTIPAGAPKADFALQGVRPGVSLLSASAGPGYQAASAKAQVDSSIHDLGVIDISGNYQVAKAGTPLPQPIVIRVADINRVGYAGQHVNLSVSPGGGIDQTSAVSDEHGNVSVTWTPGSNPLNELYATVEGSNQPAFTATALGPPAIFDGGIVNAASFQAGITPNGLGTIFGANLGAGFSGQGALSNSLGGVQVLLNGTLAQVFYVTDRQINFLVPDTLAVGSVGVTVSTPLGASPAQRLTVQPVLPGIFYDVPSGLGAILVAGTGLTTLQRPVHAGEYLEVYCTGLGELTATAGLQQTAAWPAVTIASKTAQVSYSGLAPGFLGLNQVNVQVPDGTPAGDVTLSMTVAGLKANDVKIRVQ